MAWDTTTHGMSKTRTYRIWVGMKSRCDNENKDGYGGRGISYDPKWVTFEGFFDDMGVCPSGLTLDRQDVNDNYYLDNCRWTSRTVQNHTRRKMVYKNTSEPSLFIGVSYRKSNGRWRAKLRRNGVTYIDRSFLTEIEAAIVYDMKSKEIFGDEPNKQLIEEMNNES